MRWSKYAVALSFCCGGLLIHSQKGLAGKRPAAHPNILLILADDLGYGDVSCYNASAKVDTPHLDRLATQGMRFTDAHSPSTVCTPSRYSLLTGRMCFRTGYRGVFSGVGGPALIESNRLTLPQMLRNNGYHTACIGKWHLGLTFQTSDGSPAYATNLPKVQPRDWRDGGAALERVRRVDFSKPILDGPIHRGFDQFFGTACCPTTDWLYAWIEQDRVPVPPKQQLSHDGLPQHAYSYDNRRGLIAADFDLETVDLHLPSFAAESYRGRSKAGPHGDFLLEMDDIVGQLLQTLDELNLAENTLVIFTSDNGPEVTTVVNMRKNHKHDGAAPWRGMKRDQWEGGHRVPLIVRWPKRIPAGTVSDQLVNLTDIMATCAAIVDTPLPEDAAEDSFNLLPALKDADAPPVRKWMLSQTISLALAIREGKWKLLDHTGSGGNNYQRPPLDQYRLPDTAPDAPMQLYDLESDPGETTNLYYRHPDVVQRLKSKLDEFRRTGRSAPPPTVTH